MSPERIRLEDAYEEVLAHRRELDLRDQHINHSLDALIRALQRRTLEAESQYHELETYVRTYGSPPAAESVGGFGSLEDAAAGGGDVPPSWRMSRDMQEAESGLREQLLEAEMSTAEYLSAEEHAQKTAEETLAELAEKVTLATEERDSELQQKEIFATEELCQQRRNEAIEMEIRQQVAASEAFQDQRYGLESKVRTLQQEVHRVVYHVGQKDQELASKNAEIQDVRKRLRRSRMRWTRSIGNWMLDATR